MMVVGQSVDQQEAGIALVVAALPSTVEVRQSGEEIPASSTDQIVTVDHTGGGRAVGADEPTFLIRFYAASMPAAFDLYRLLEAAVMDRQTNLPRRVGIVGGRWYFLQFALGSPSQDTIDGCVRVEALARIATKEIG